MHLSVWIVLALLLVYVTAGFRDEGRGIEGFVPAPPRRSDIGRAEDGWVEEPGYDRDLRFTEGFVDLQQRGWGAVDFCRAVSKRGDPDSLRIACALGARDGMDTLEYTSRTVRDGFRMSRDDYFNGPNYCRVLRDPETGGWTAMCAPAARTGFRPVDTVDTAPPPRIQALLDAYEGIHVWYRWQDDGVDYAEATVSMTVGPSTGVVIPSILRPVVTRGLQLNRWPQAAQEAGDVPAQLDPRSCVRIGNADTMTIGGEATKKEGKIRAMACWVWWDTFASSSAPATHPHILDCADRANKDRIWFGVECGGVSAPAPASVSAPTPAQELRPEHLLAVGKKTEPLAFALAPSDTTTSTATEGTYLFEVWDQDQRLVRLESPPGQGARLHTWQHLVLTTTDSTSWWPTWQMWIDGRCVASHANGRLCPAMELAQNFVGRGMRGCIQDFRIYGRALGEPDIQAARAWGVDVLHPMP